MASARFRLGTATTNSAGTTWSWRAYDTAADITSGSYVKVELESNTGVRTISVSIPSADPATVSAGTPTVTTVQASKTATFQAGTGAARTYLVRAQINSGIDQNGDSVDAYTKQLAVHIVTVAGKRLLAVGETDEASRAYGWTTKVNDLVSYIATQAITMGSSATPSTATGSGILYTSGGALLFRGGSGSITVIAPA